MSAQAKKLKDEGNALFLKKEYSQACSSFSASISLDVNNAILYANRAACRLAMNQYMDALDDGKKATELDPNYPKAWYRCASALGAMGQYAQSASMFEKTLEALSRLPEASSDRNLQKQCETQLAQARKAAALPLYMSEGAVQIEITAGLSPWEAAAKLLPGIVRNSTVSSAWVIYSANEDFAEGVKMLNEMIVVESSVERTVKARLGVLVEITNAILRDERVFRIDQPDFLVNMVDQIESERNHWKSWPPETGPEALREKALERLRKEGWDSCRGALSLIVRNWLFAGFAAQKATSNVAFALESHRNALNIINWGRQVWKDVPSDIRGPIFDLSFRRGVWNMLLNTLMAALDVDKTNLALLETIFEEAVAIIRDIDDNPYKPQDFIRPPERLPPDPGFYFSFFAYIKGNSLACKGLYHRRLAEIGEDRNPETIRNHYTSAMDLYIEAANCLPEDDEEHPWYLNCAYNFMEIINVPTKRVMNVLERIRLSIPKMRKIWSQNPQRLSQYREDTYARLLKIEQCARSLIVQNIMILDGPFAWDTVKRL